MRTIISILFYFCLLSAFAQQTRIIKNTHGETASVEDIVAAAQDKQFIFFGEMHGEAIAHQLELELLERLYSLYGEKLVLGMEMFETDVQPIVEEYWKGQINTRSFESETRIWNNYADYRPLVEFAKAHHIPLIATNIPRRYANAVYHQGIAVLDSLSDYAKALLPPLPMAVDTTLATYRELKNMIPGHGGENMLYSQAIKDASMAYRILINTTSDRVMLHLHGAYHSKNREGILSFMRSVPPDKILTIATVPADGENTALGEADFTIMIPLKAD